MSAIVHAVREARARNAEPVSQSAANHSQEKVILPKLETPAFSAKRSSSSMML